MIWEIVMVNLRNKKYFLFDGAFGTYYSLLYSSEEPCEFANFNNREAVINIHKEYISAGSMAIKTNTFAANTFSLGVEFDLIEKIIEAGWSIANEAVSASNVEIFADIGPIPSEDEDVIGEYHKIIDKFITLGAVNFIFETMNDLLAFELSDYVKAKLADSFVIVSYAVGQDGYTIKGIPSKAIVLAAEKSSVDAFGFNCICGPLHLLKIVSDLDKNDKLMSVMPNSGYPSIIDGRTVYIDNASYFAEKILQIHAAGVKILGGCCGTTPAHIKATADLIEHAEEALPITRATKISASMPTENAFATKLLAGDKVIAVELDPPLDVNYSHIFEAAPYLKSVGADVITLADSPLARPRADSVIISAKVQREAGIQAIPHLTCRDHNTIGLKSVLLGGSIEGIRNILIVTGDPIPSVDRSEIKGVFSTNSYDLIHYVEHLNGDIFKGQEFFVGGALNINAEKFDFELKRAIKKQENGTKFLMTQPIYSDIAIENLRLAKETLSLKILAGIMPIATYKNAVFLNNEVSGIDIPQEIIEKMEGKTSEEVMEISIEYSMGIVKKIRDICDGYYLMTPLKKYLMIGELVKRIKEQI